MKVVILGSGGMGALTLSHLIANMSIKKGISVKSSEIHGMAKKGGLVEIQMKIGEGKSGVVIQGEADIAIIFKENYRDYGKTFLSNKGQLIEIKDKEIENFTKEFGDIKYVSSLMLGKFIKIQALFNDNDAIEVLSNMRNKEINLKAFKRGKK